ncbi:DUF4347 domain-containing protein [Rhodovibrio salinarum]|nr:DUF4347 domain-containing protein [Rhodovibrio salinarum]
MTKVFRDAGRTLPAQVASHTPDALAETDALFALALEPRLLLDAAAAATAADTAEDGGGSDGSTDTSAVDQGDAPHTSKAAAGDELAAQTLAKGAGELVFIDTGVSGWETLADAVDPSAELVLVDANADGLQVMADTLSGRSEVQAVHVVGHGAVGAFQLGRATVTTESLSNYSAQIEAVGNALSAEGDILLYGCYVGADGAGSAFLQALADATGADVSASEDLTGASNLGGDWDLEAAVGSVEASSLIDSSSGFTGTLAVSDENFDGRGFIDVTSPSTTIGDWIFGASASNRMATPSQAEAPYNLNVDEGASDRNLVWNINGLNLTDFYFTSADGSDFTLSSFDFGAGSGSSMSLTISGLRDGSTVVSAESVNLSSSDSTGNITYTQKGSTSGGDYGTLTFGAAFNNVDRINFSFSAAAVPEIDNITVSLSDTTAPTLTSIERQTPSTGVTNADSLTFRATFSEGVQNVSTDDFTVSGGSTASVTGVSQVNATTYDVTVSGGDLAAFEGTVGLDVASGQDIADTAGNAFGGAEPATDETYTLDNTAPSLSVPDLVTASDSGSSDSDDLTSDTTPTVEYTAETGTTVEIDWDDGNGFVAAGTGNGSAQQATLASAYASDGAKTITVRATDGAGNVSSQTHTITLDTQAPTVATNTGVSVNEGGTVTVGSSALAASDTVDTDANLVFNLTGTTHGALALNGSTLSNGNTFTQADIDNNRITFVHDGSETTSGSFAFTVQDTAGNVLGGQSASVSVTLQNDNTPVASNDTDTTNENSSISRNAANGVIDPNDTDGDTNASLSVTTVNNGTTSVGAGVQIAGDNGGLFTINADGSYAFDPNGEFDDLASGSRATAVTYTLSDGATSDTATLTVTVTGLNDAPTLTGGTATLSGTDENTTSGGTTVASILTDTGYADADTGASSGIAVTGVSANGTWQYSTDGTVWTAFGAVNTSSSLLLGSGSQVRYVPGNTGETATFAFRAWDQTSGTASTNGSPQSADTSVIGGTTAFSTTSASASLTVTEINDAPTLTASGQNPAFQEGDAAPGADLFSGVTASTVESGQSFSGLSLTVTNLADGAGEILRLDGSDVVLTDGTSVTTATNGLTVDVSVTGGTATVSFTGASLSAAALQTLVDGLSYRNTSDAPTTGANRLVTITGVTDSGGTANGGDDTAALSIASTVSLTPVNDPPVIGNVDGASSSVVAGTGNANIDLFDTATVTNPDSADYNGGFLTIAQTSGTTNGNWGLDGTTATAGGDGTIAAGETVAVGGVSLGTVDATADGQGGNALTIAFDANATSSNIQTLLQALTYGAPSALGARTFDLTLNDADGTANGGDQDTAVSFTVSVTPNPPIIGNLDGDSVTVANGTAISIDVGGNATVSDADSSTFDGGNLTIARTSGLSGDFSLTGSGATGVSSGPSSGTADGTIAASETVYVDGVSVATVAVGSDGQGSNDLVLTFNANATPARVQSLIHALQYSSSAGGSHTFDLNVSDSAAGPSQATSSAASFTVDVDSVPVNTVPGAQTATDGQALALGGISVADADSANVTTTVAVPGGDGTFQASASGGATLTGAGTNSLQIAGTVADVNTTLASLTYSPAVDATGTQTITVTTSDGSSAPGGPNTDVDTITVTVSDRPTLANLDGDTVSYSEQGGPVALDAGGDLTLGDNDSATFTGGSLTLAYQSGQQAEDRLVIDTSGTVTLSAGQSAGSTVSIGGTAVGTLQPGATGGSGEGMTITLGAGATPARLATLIGAIGYDNTAGDTPSAGDRTIRVTVDDGSSAGASDPADVTVQVTAVNDAPTASGVPTTLTATEDVASNVDLTGLTLGDIDAGANPIALILSVDAGTLTAASGGGVTAGGTGSDTLTLTGSVADLNAFLGSASAVAYTSAPDASGTGAATLTLNVNDQGHSGSGGGDVLLGSASINVIAVNDAPTVDAAPVDQTATEDAAFDYQLPANTFGDSDAGDTLTLTAELADGSPLPGWLSFDPTTRTFSGTPGDGDSGTLNVAVTATDATGETATATFALAVEPGGDPVSPTVTPLTRGPVQVTVIDTGGETVLVATSNQSVSGNALAAILNTFDKGNSPLAQTFRQASSNASDVPSQTLQTALGDPTTRRALADINALSGEALIFDGGQWQPLNLETLLQLFNVAETSAANDTPNSPVQDPTPTNALATSKPPAANTGGADNSAPAGDSQGPLAAGRLATGNDHSDAVLATARATAKAHWLDAAITALAAAEPLDSGAPETTPQSHSTPGATGGFSDQLRARAGAFDREAAALADQLAEVAS